MKKTNLLFVPLFLFVACGDGKDHAAGSEGNAHEEHAAKHGGDLLPLGDHEGFLEVKLDHAAGSLNVWVYMGEEMNAATPDRAPLLNVKTAAGPKQLTGQGSGNTWSFRDESLKAEPENARFRVVVGGKIYSPTWEHHHGGEEGENSHEGHDHD